MSKSAESIVKVVVTKNEKAELKFIWVDLLLMHLECFGRTKGEITFLKYIAARTLRYGYYYIDLHVNEFFQCKGTGCIPPLNCSMNYLRRVRSNLRDLGVLFYRCNRGHGRYALNVVGMLRWLTAVGEGSYSMKTMEMAKRVLKRTQGRFDHLGFDTREPIFLTEDGMDTQEAILAGRRQSAEAQKKKAAKPMKSAGDIRVKLLSYCEKYGLRYVESKWTVVQKTNAKRWIKTINENPDEMTAEKMLENVVRLWVHFRKGVLTNDKGQALTLPSYVSFWDFFVHRQRIEPWVIEHMDEPEPESKYIQRVEGEMIQL